MIDEQSPPVSFGISVHISVKETLDRLSQMWMCPRSQVISRIVQDWLQTPYAAEYRRFYGEVNGSGDHPPLPPPY